MPSKMMFWGWCVGLAMSGGVGAPASAATLTEDAKDLKIKREMTGLGFAPEVSVEKILEYVRSKRGGADPLFHDEEKLDQIVLLDAKGKRWTAETDGGVVDLKDDLGRMPLVFETKTEWFKSEGVDRMLLSLEALLAAGARPDYRYGGGHFHVRMRPYFVAHPIQMASFVNLALTYEPILVHLFMNERRVDNATPLTLTRMTREQLNKAGLPGEKGLTLGQYLGRGLNGLLQNPQADCRTQDPALIPYFNAEHIAGQTIQEGCILAFLSRFGFEIVGRRETAINIQSWRGAVSRIKRHDSIELRLFDAPKTLREAEMEERLVRGMANRAMLTDSQGYAYLEKVDAAYDLDSYYQAYHPERREADWKELLGEAGIEGAQVRAYLDEYLDEAKQKARRLFRP